MSNSGVIRGHISILDYGKLGYGFISLIFMQIEGEYFVEVDEELAIPSEVVAVYDITGEFDVVLVTKFLLTTQAIKEC